MLRIALLFSLAVIGAGPARAQVQVTELAAPDAFSTPGRETGLPPSLWRGTPPELARVVLPMLAARPLSPAAADLARRALATGAAGPEGSRGDDNLAGGRVSALIALGDLAAAAAILERTAGLDRSVELAQAAAEAALLTDDPARACAIATALATGRGDIYWLRLRAFCQVEAGQADQAQLTFDLAQTQTRDAVFGRLLGARLNGAPAGAASLRHGLDLALSRSLKLDLALAKPSPSVASALSGGRPAVPEHDLGGVDSATRSLADSLAQGPPPAAGIAALIAAAADADVKARPRLQASALLLTALQGDLAGPDRTRLARFALADGRAPIGRTLALDAAVEAGRVGETALLALWISADAGAGGLAVADRVRIVRALNRVGLAEDARNFALEGVAGLK